MNVFTKIRNRIESFFSKITGEREENPKTYFDIQDDLTEISKQQEIERKKVVDKIKNTTLLELSPHQIDLVEKKSKTLDVRNYQIDFQKFKEINYEIERLETNIMLQSRIKFIPKEIDNELINLLSVQLIDERLDKKPLELKSEKRLKFEEERKTDIEKIRILKDEILNFSLTKIHQKREEEKKEKERIERERIINEQFKIHIENSQKHLTLNNYEQALQELLNAIKIKPEKEKELIGLITEIRTKKQEFNKRLDQFNKIFNKAQVFFHSGDLERAIFLYKKALKLNIDNLKCKRRISDANYKIQRLKELEVERIKKEKEEKERKEKYKDDAEAIMNYFKQNGIYKFYHYTDTRNINSILQNSGLYSLNEMMRRGIDFTRGSETREKPDYVRMSYVRNHPLMYVSINSGRIINAKVLEVDIEIAGLRKTMFTNVNTVRTATYPTVRFGTDLNFIKENVKLDIVKQPNYLSLNEDDKPYYQAEIMVKDHVELEYIKNLND